ncbi:uncharacterized protein LOC127253426 isoform X7 [Andrographis paniculata]|uniref:uncharacterized protein LOC127253426 isoform X7 n=1 Tax=Andrographis paniculata TaxID=175694 RepID=UPI0021E9084A|nr:uncharacterized protein LOC127253426 isoform X7 [Andrographis paniculata]
MDKQQHHSLNIPHLINLKFLPQFDAGSASHAAANKDRRMQAVEQHLRDICNADLRENVLHELSKAEERYISRFSSNSVAFLRYYCCSSPVCGFTSRNTNAIFKCKSRPFEYLRLTSLGVIGALVKVDDTDVIAFLLSTEIIPLCLRTMEMGSELSKTVATFIVQKILLDEVGLEYICTTAERFFAVSRVLANMVAALAEQPSPRLLKHIIRCYRRLSDKPRACEALRSCLPDIFRDGALKGFLVEDPLAALWLQELIYNVLGTRVAIQVGSSFDHMMIN